MSNVNLADIWPDFDRSHRNYFRDDGIWIGHLRYEMWSQLVFATYLSLSDHFLIFTKLSADPRPRHLTTFLSFHRLHSILQSTNLVSNQSMFSGCLLISYY